MTDLPYTHPVRAADLTGRRDRAFDLRPDAAACAAIAATLGINAVADLAFAGHLRPAGRADVMLEARLEATVDQPCVVTLVPVRSRIDVPVARRYVAGMAAPEGAEVEMPEDDTLEPLPEVIDLGAVMVEALALALPDYPRAPGAELGEAVFAAPGVAALRDADLRPFAALARLRPGGEGDKG
ncbi:YceD family protein [Ruixingdingia sedimenti]|uniref:DUF177 domain-containing protein n=1 Tax=Ruixingdingia sedimenti TaxID=3073604 RepID=A0ABU1F4C4_9RHOB|nr:DUF177 domain-containing protein [Xinfangfangia sp. LG-4]MDR5651709.1 DUF177 domain-containing protein [Xinfangfangia sp. LG-4]